jgi:peptidoglycan hydrolase-like protein with peptidoglycan-binding domain
MRNIVRGAVFASVFGAFCIANGGMAVANGKPPVGVAKAGVPKPRIKPITKKRNPSRLIRKLQAALNRHGAKLRVDGHIGTKRRAALKRFQSENGLRQTGHADKLTMARLGVRPIGRAKH